MIEDVNCSSLFQEARFSAKAKDEKVAEKFWDASLKFTGLK